MSLGKKILAAIVVFIAAIAALGVVGVVFVAPSVAKSQVETRLVRVEEKLGVEVTTGAIEMVGIGGVEISNLVIKDPKTGRTLLTVDRVGAKISVPRILVGERVVTELWSDGVHATVTREEDGGLDVIRLIKERKSSTAEPEPEDEDQAASSGGILRLFGGTLPAVDVTNVTVTFEAVSGVEAFPVEVMKIPSLGIVHGDNIEVSTKVNVTSVASDQWSLPSEVEVQLAIDDELTPQSLNVKFDRTVAVSGLGPVPFLKAGFTGVELSPEGRFSITDPHLGFRSDDKPFAGAESVSVGIAKFALDPRDIVLSNLTVERPQVSLVFDAQGASQLTDLDHALRSPRARDVASRARGLARKAEERRRRAAAREPAAENEPEEDEVPKPAAVAEPEGPSKLQRLIAKLPLTMQVNDAVVNVTDGRELPVVRRATKLRLEGGNLHVTHNSEAGEFRVEGSFSAIADEQKRGSVKGLVGLGYLSKKFDADIEVDSLDLSWLGQMLGPSVAENVRGGTIRGKLDVKPAKGSAVSISGNASVENLVYYWDLLAEEPVEEFTASYGFTAIYDPAGKMPPSKLLKKGLYKDSNRPAADDPIHTGSLVFTKGSAQMGDARATVLPSIFGTGALPERMPARLDLRVNLPTTPVQTLFEAVPAAIQGPLKGTEMAGTFAWGLELELPPYRAGDMEWASNPTLDEFELVAIPKEVDPQKLMDGFKLTIQTTLEDKKGEEYEWSRTIRVPKAKPISAKYLVENAGLEIQNLDERRREREWPPVPDARNSWLPKITLESPEYWLTSAAENSTAKVPWTPGEPIERTEREPYGPYVFVPLQHISKWAVRVVTTTEDGGFFRHPGFLFDSLKESVEDNIEASRFRRGGSTISMQLVKNAFLDQKKLLARKMREAFLVFLMESIVNVPKSRILEVYLNIIEFGPGIYGMHDAAVHYFGKHPDALEVDEVAWLFSILPAPKKYHFYWDKGEISDKWFAKMKRYLDAMVRRDKLDAEARDLAAEAAPVFYKPNIELEEPVLKPKEVAIDPFMLEGAFPEGGPRTPTPGLTTPATGLKKPTPAPLKQPPSNKKKKKKKSWLFGR